MSRVARYQYTTGPIRADIAEWWAFILGVRPPHGSGMQIGDGLMSS
jgi:hypothetical protein